MAEKRKDLEPMLNFGLSIEQAKKLVRDLEWYIQQAENSAAEWEAGVADGKISDLDSPIYILWDPWPESISGNAGVYTVTCKGAFPGDGILSVSNELRNYVEKDPEIVDGDPLY